MEEQSRGLLPASDAIRVTYRPSPFRSDVEIREFPVGVTVAEIVESLAIDTEHQTVSVAINGEKIEKAAWSGTKPQGAALVTIVAFPGGIEAMLIAAVIAASNAIASIPVIGAVASFVGGFAAAGATALGAGAVGAVVAGSIGTIVVGAALTYGASLALAALTKPPEQDIAGSKGYSESPSVQGTRNAVVRGGVVPRVYGKYRVYPPYGAAPYSETIAGKQYIRGVVVVSSGECQISDIRIGDTPIGDIPGAEWEVREGKPEDEPLSLYTKTVHQQGVNASFPTAHSKDESKTSDWIVRRTDMNCSRISLEFNCPGGIMRRNENGSTRSFNFLVEIEYRAVGDPDWLPMITWNPATGDLGNNGRVTYVGGSQLEFYGLETRPFLQGMSKATTPGQYEVRIRRIENMANNGLPGGSDTSVVQADLIWTTLKSWETDYPINLTGLAMIAFRVEANETIKGVLSEVNCMAEARIPVWDGSTWTGPQLTRSQAWAFADVLRGSSNPRPIGDTWIDTDALTEWDEFCSEKGFTFDAVIDYETTVFQLANNIAATARASYATKNAQHSVIVDKPRTVIAQMFTPHNSSGFEGAKAFADFPHALRIGFVNSENEYQLDERIVYADGYDENNATKFESLQLFGAMTPDRAWKEGRYWIALGRLRPENYTLNVDIEHLVCQRGDLVQVTHDVPMWGQAWGRITAVTNASTYQLDNKWTAVNGTEYTAVVRRTDGTFATLEISTPLTVLAQGFGTFNLMKLLENASPALSVGDLVGIGQKGQATHLCLVGSIRHTANLTATLGLVDYSPELYSIDTGPIPAFDPDITPRGEARVSPPTPVIDQCVSDESAVLSTPAGGLLPSIYLVFHAGTGSPIPDVYEIRFRPSATATTVAGGWEYLPLLPLSATNARITDVAQGVAYDIQLRTRVSAGQYAGAASDWRSVNSHTVVGLSTPPPDPHSLFVTTGPMLTWQYGIRPVDFLGFEVRFHFGENENWASATPLHNGVVTDTRFALSARGSGLRTYFVKAVDREWNYSDNAAVCIVDIGDILADNIVLTEDEHAAGFPGEKTNCTVSGGDLVADSEVAQFWGNEASRFWVDDAEPFWGQNFKELQYATTVQLTTATPRGEIYVEPVYEGESLAIEYQPDAMFWTGDANPFWTSDANEFWAELDGEMTAFPGSLTATQGTYFFRFTIPAGARQGKITGLDFVHDVPDVVERLPDVAIGSGGTRLTLTKTFEAITAISITVQDDAGTGITARIKDKNISLGPLIEVLDAAGAAVAGTVDAVVQGY